MKSDTLERLDDLFKAHTVMRAAEVPSEAEVADAAQHIGIPFPHDYRTFLLKYGAAIVGPHPVFGLRQCHALGNQWSVVSATQRARSSGVDGLLDWIIFSEDLSGNPVGLDTGGSVWIYDHDFGGASPLASAFEDYIRRHCLKIET